MDRPKLKPKQRTLDRIFDIILGIGTMVLILMPLYYYQDLPKEIPMHFDASGEVDSYSGRNSIWFLSMIGVVVVAGLRWLREYPQIYNYPVKITNKNAEIQYLLAQRMIVITAIFIAFLFSIIQYVVITAAISSDEVANVSIIYWFIGLMFISIIYYLIKSYSSAKNL